MHSFSETVWFFLVWCLLYAHFAVGDKDKRPQFFSKNRKNKIGAPNTARTTIPVDQSGEVQHDIIMYWNQRNLDDSDINIVLKSSDLQSEGIHLRNENTEKLNFRRFLRAKPLVYRVMITPVTGLSSVLVFSNKALPDFSKIVIVKDNKIVYDFLPSTSSTGTISNQSLITNQTTREAPLRKEYPATSIRFTEDGLCVNPVFSMLPPPVITRLALRHDCRTLDSFFTITQDGKLQHIASGLYVGDVTNLLSSNSLASGNVGVGLNSLGGTSSFGGNVDGNQNPLDSSSSVNGNNVDGNENPLGGSSSVNGNNVDGSENPLGGSSSGNGNNVDGNENPLSGSSSVNGNNVDSNENPLGGSSSVNGNNVDGNKNPLVGSSSVNGNNVDSNKNPLVGSSSVNGNNVDGNENPLVGSSSVNGNNVDGNKNPLGGSSSVNGNNVDGNENPLGGSSSVKGNNVDGNENPLGGSSSVNGNNVDGNKNPLSGSSSVNGNNVDANKNPLSGSSSVNGNNVDGNKNPLSGSSSVNGNNVDGNENPLGGSSSVNGNNVDSNKNPLGGSSSVNGNNVDGNKNPLSGSSSVNGNNVDGNENPLVGSSSVNGNNVDGNTNPQADSLFINGNKLLHNDGGNPGLPNSKHTSTVGIGGSLVGDKLAGGKLVGGKLADGEYLNHDDGNLGHRNYKHTSSIGIGSKLPGGSLVSDGDVIRNHYSKLARVDDGNIGLGRIDIGVGMNRKPSSRLGNTFNTKQTSTDDDSGPSAGANAHNKFAYGKLLTSGTIDTPKNTETNTLQTIRHYPQHNYHHRTKPFITSSDYRRSLPSLTKRPLDLYLKPWSELAFTLTSSPNQELSGTLPEGRSRDAIRHRHYVKFGGRGNEEQFKRQHVIHSKMERSRRGLTDLKSYLQENETRLCIGYQNKRVILMSCQSVPSSVEMYDQTQNQFTLETETQSSPPITSSGTQVTSSGTPSIPATQTQATYNNPAVSQCGSSCPSTCYPSCTQSCCNTGTSYTQSNPGSCGNGCSSSCYPSCTSSCCNTDYPDDQEMSQSSMSSCPGNCATTQTCPSNQCPQSCCAGQGGSYTPETQECPSGCKKHCRSSCPFNCC